MYNIQYPGIMNTTLDQATAASPVMVALLKLRCRQYMRHAIEEIRNGELQRAAYHLGIAQGQVFALYDTHAVAWRFEKAARKIYVVLDHRLRAAAEKSMLQFSYPTL